MALRIVDVRPNPVTSHLAIHFALANGGAARLELLDIAGRRVRSTALEGGASGERTMGWELGSDIPSGLYWLRLSQAGKSVTTRVVVVR